MCVCVCDLVCKFSLKECCHLLTVSSTTTSSSRARLDSSSSSSAQRPFFLLPIPSILSNYIFSLSNLLFFLILCLSASLSASRSLRTQVPTYLPTSPPLLDQHHHRLIRRGIIFLYFENNTSTITLFALNPKQKPWASPPLSRPARPPG